MIFCELGSDEGDTEGGSVQQPRQVTGSGTEGERVAASAESIGVFLFYMMCVCVHVCM